MNIKEKIKNWRFKFPLIKNRDKKFPCVSVSRLSGSLKDLLLVRSIGRGRFCIFTDFSLTVRKIEILYKFHLVTL